MNEKALMAICVVLAVLLVATNVYWISRPSETTVKLNFAYQIGFHYGVSVVMDHFDLVEKHSDNRIQANYFKISGGTAINEAVVAGSVDFAQMGSAPAIKGVDQGIGTKILASFGSKEHEVWTWRTDIQSLSDFKEGAIISVVKLYSIEHVGLIKAFVDMGRTEEDTDAISAFFSHSDSYHDLDEGEIDAHFVGVPYATMYAQDSRYHKISGDTEIWGMPLAGGVFIGKSNLDEWIVAAVLEAWLESIEWIKNNPKEASEIIGAVYDYTKEEAWEIWQTSGIVWNPSFGLDVLETQAGLMYDLGIINNPLKNKDLLFEQAPKVTS
ncbi:hypothetical protein ES702_00372 [subsurface metagenome]